MDKQSKKLLQKAINGCIASVELVTTDDVHQLVFDLVSKRQKLYSLILHLKSDGLVTTTLLRNKTSDIKILSNYAGLQIEDVLIQDEYVLICTNDLYLHIDTKTGNLKHMTNKEGRSMHDLFSITENGF